MRILVVYPSRSHTAYEIAADAFVDLAERVGNTEAKKITDEEYLTLNTRPEKTVLIGHDGANDVLAALLLENFFAWLPLRHGRLHNPHGENRRNGISDPCGRTAARNNLRSVSLF